MPDRHYPHAPITEALVDLRVTYGADTSLKQLRSFGAGIKDSYPFEATRDVFQAEFQARGAQTSSSSARETVGYIFHSADRKQAVQARLDGFTFSRFAPYENWPALLRETRRLWEHFVTMTNPQRVGRVAVRYINQINLPMGNGGVRFEDYLRTFPEVGNEGFAIPDHTIEQFFMRIVMPQEDLQARVVLTQALLPPKTEALVSVILDIDLFRDGTSFSVGSEEIWDLLLAFRARKNLYFEASLTDKARELFQ